MTAVRSEGRLRGRIEERGASLRVSVYAGTDPVTGKRVYLRETVKGTDKTPTRRRTSALRRSSTVYWPK